MIPAPASRLVLPGLDLPGDYGNAAAEYAVLAEGAGLLDFRHLGFVRCKGSEAAGFLQGLLTQDVQRLSVGSAAGTWLLNAGGKILHAARVYRRATDSFLLAVHRGEVDAVLSHLDRYLIMEDAVLSEAPDLAMFSVQGKTAADWQKIPGFVHDRCGFGGMDLVLDRQQQEETSTMLSDLPPVGFAALNRARIEAFIPWFGPDMKAGGNPLIYGNGGRVSNTKGCFIGQETVAKTRDRGRPPRLLVQVTATHAAMPEPGAALLQDGKVVGDVSSVTSGKTGLCALAVAKYAVVDCDTLTDSDGAAWTINRRADYKSPN